MGIGVFWGALFVGLTGFFIPWWPWWLYVDIWNHYKDKDLYINRPCHSIQHGRKPLLAKFQPDILTGSKVTIIWNFIWSYINYCGHPSNKLSNISVSRSVMPSGNFWMDNRIKFGPKPMGCSNLITPKYAKKKISHLWSYLKLLVNNSRTNRDKFTIFWE